MEANVFCNHASREMGSDSYALTVTHHPTARHSIQETPEYYPGSFLLQRLRHHHGAPNWCNTGSDEAAAIDVVNFYMKPGNEADGFSADKEMLSEYCAVVASGVSECSASGDTGILPPAELAKPFFNTESGYSGFEPDSWDGGRGALKLGGKPYMPTANEEKTCA